MRISPNLTLTASTLAFALASAPAAAQVAQDAPTVPGQAAADTVEQDPATTGGDVVVTGIRRSLSTAQEVKRNSDQIVDTIIAEDIGKLPDNNASEAIARVTGVQVNRSGDEANGVLIRGLPNVATTVQGREIFTADGRFVQVQDFPADSLAALEVFKANTAVNLEGGIAGLINVKLRRPFDLEKEGLTVAGGGRVIYYDQSRKYDRRAAFWSAAGPTPGSAKSACWSTRPIHRPTI